MADSTEFTIDLGLKGAAAVTAAGDAVNRLDGRNVLEPFANGRALRVAQSVSGLRASLDGRYDRALLGRLHLRELLGDAYGDLPLVDGGDELRLGVADHRGSSLDGCSSASTSSASALSWIMT